MSLKSLKTKRFKACFSGILTKIIIIVIVLSTALQISCNASESIKRDKKKSPYTCNGILSFTSTRFISDADEPYERNEFTALFPKYKDVDAEDVERLLPTHIPDSSLAMDTCSSPVPIIKPSRKQTITKQDLSTLLDAGNIFINQGDGKKLIQTRTFPDLLQIINGVIYFAGENSGIRFIPEQTYTITTMGSDSIGKFEVLLDAPDDLGDIKINNVSPSEIMPVLITGQPIVISWEGSGHGDEVILNLNWTGPGLSWNMKCRMKDDGNFTIPVQISKHIIIDQAISTHEISLTRVRQVSFVAPGISSGDFSFAVTSNFLVEFDENN